MLSVIVCSVNPYLLNQLKNNIEATIGVDYELLSIDNRIEKKGICSIYNSLAERAKFDILCFVHEDVLFETLEWGKKLVDLYATSKALGAIGVAGSKYKSANFSGWFTGQKEFDCANILHRSGKNIEKKIFLKPNKNNRAEEVVCLDGVFISCKKSIWSAIKFDEINLKGFHLYDIDFSLRIARKYTVMVTYQIDIVHLTEGGDFTNNWMETTMQYHLQHQRQLPFQKSDIKKDDVELQIAKATLDMLKNYSILWKNKLKWIKAQKLYLHSSLFYPIAKFLLYKPLNLKFIHNLLKME